MRHAHCCLLLRLVPCTPMVCVAPDSLPDLKRSWDNLMWNLEIDNDDLDSEKQMKAAMDGVLASLVEVSSVELKVVRLISFRVLVSDMVS